MSADTIQAFNKIFTVTNTTVPGTGPNGETCCGYPGKRKFIIKAVGPGSASFNISLSRPWEKVAAVDAISFNVTVNEKNTTNATPTTNNSTLIIVSPPKAISKVNMTDLSDQKVLAGLVKNGLKLSVGTVKKLTVTENSSTGFIWQMSESDN